MINYGFVKELDMDFGSAVELVREHLHDAGFGVLTTIDVKEQFAHKLGLDLEDYLILGVCDPTTAQKAICAEQHIGLMLPSNVIIYQEAGKVIVAAVRPTVVMHLVENLDLHRVARDIERRLKDFIESLQPARVSS